MSRSSVALTDHDEIRKWVESHGGVPATVNRTGKGGEEAGILRIDFPDGTEPSLEQISWEEFFQKFDEKNLALLTGSGGKSLFNKFVSRDSVEAKTSGGRSGKSRSAGSH